MGMVPSYKTNEWKVLLRSPSNPTNSVTTGKPTIQIRVLDGDEWRDYWVPQDATNGDYIQYQEWLAEGNDPRIIL